MGGWWDWVDGGLNAAGMIPGVGMITNGISALGNAVQGNWGQAGLSAAGMIPGVGVMSGAARLGRLGKMGVGLAKGIGRAGAHVPGARFAAGHIAPAIHAMQPYSAPMNRAAGWGGMFLGGSGSNQPQQPQQQYQAPMPQPQYQAQSNPMSGAYDMFKGFFNQGAPQQQAQAHSLAPQGSIYGNS